MLSKVIAKNVGDVFLGTHCTSKSISIYVFALQE